MHVPEIIEVKEHLEKLRSNGLVENWELPYENILTRRSAAIFFINLPEDNTHKLWKELSQYENFSYKVNTEQKLSTMKYLVTFSIEEKEKNEVVAESVSN